MFLKLYESTEVDRSSNLATCALEDLAIVHQQWHSPSAVESVLLYFTF